MYANMVNFNAIFSGNYVKSKNILYAITKGTIKHCIRIVRFESCYQSLLYFSAQNFNTAIFRSVWLVMIIICRRTLFYDIVWRQIYSTCRRSTVINQSFGWCSRWSIRIHGQCRKTSMKSRSRVINYGSIAEFDTSDDTVGIIWPSNVGSFLFEVIIPVLLLLRDECPIMNVFLLKSVCNGLLRAIRQYNIIRQHGNFKHV